MSRDPFFVTAPNGTEQAEEHARRLADNEPIAVAMEHELNTRDLTALPSRLKAGRHRVHNIMAMRKCWGEAFAKWGSKPSDFELASGVATLRRLLDCMKNVMRVSLNAGGKRSALVEAVLWVNTNTDNPMPVKEMERLINPQSLSLLNELVTDGTDRRGNVDAKRSGLALFEYLNSKIRPSRADKRMRLMPA